MPLVLGQTRVPWLVDKEVKAQVKRVCADHSVMREVCFSTVRLVPESSCDPCLRRAFASITVSPEIPPVGSDDSWQA